MTDRVRNTTAQQAAELLSGLKTSLDSGWTKRARGIASMGAAGAAAHLGRHLMRRLRGGEAFRLFLVVLTEPRPTAAAQQAAKNHTLRFATLEDLERLQADPTSNFSPWDVDAHREGCRCLLQLDGEKLVGHTWVSTAPLIELRWGLHFNMPDDMVYNYHGYTAPQYRGTAFQALRHLKLLELMKSQGKRRLLGYVDDLNYRSLRGVEKSGYRRVGTLSGLKRGGQTHLSLSIDDGAWSQLVRVGPRQRQAAAGRASKIVA
jgi:hypothetical protein